ncbi:hypothetical protein JK364_51915 [Streptomyces sp. 110]|uniref:Uncharacterized protein n=1 Tax=Streptomyces endocoffeicus TaxID=2898945 RepID=A0ABS1Q7Q9_9ACTN|nr:hypothetical protein [Streptomyces endocoffeicus]MBL1120713.1 hypothetical protein [Streptomyces endocoffeicus]
MKDAADRPAGDLVYGQSVTDACRGRDTTVGVLDRLARAAAKRRTLPRR